MCTSWGARMAGSLLPPSNGLMLRIPSKGGSPLPRSARHARPQQPLFSAGAYTLSAGLMARTTSPESRFSPVLFPAGPHPPASGILLTAKQYRNSTCCAVHGVFAARCAKLGPLSAQSPLAQGLFPNAPNSPALRSGFAMVAQSD